MRCCNTEVSILQYWKYSPKPTYKNTEILRYYIASPLQSPSQRRQRECSSYWNHVQANPHEWPLGTQVVNSLTLEVNKSLEINLCLSAQRECMEESGFRPEVHHGSVDLQNNLGKSLVAFLMRPPALGRFGGHPISACAVGAPKSTTYGYYGGYWRLSPKAGFGTAPAQCGRSHVIVQRPRWFR